MTAMPSLSLSPFAFSTNAYVNGCSLQYATLADFPLNLYMFTAYYCSNTEF